MHIGTADLCDNNQDKKIQVLSPNFNSYGGLSSFCGQITTIQLDKSNWDLLDMLKNEDGKGKIVIVDVKEAFYGVVGDKLSAFALNNNYTALIINGYVRDTKECETIGIGLYALDTCPLRNFDPSTSIKQESVSFGSVTFNEGDYLYADEDGVIVCSEPLS